MRTPETSTRQRLMARRTGTRRGNKCGLSFTGNSTRSAWQGTSGRWQKPEWKNMTENELIDELNLPPPKFCKIPACPFCGKAVDLEDNDTLYPSGTGWKFDEELQMRTYHNLRKVPKEQWCWGMHCPEPAGGCGAEIHGDSKQEALAKWSKRVPNETSSPAAEGSPVE